MNLKKRKFSSYLADLSFGSLSRLHLQSSLYTAKGAAIHTLLFYIRDSIFFHSQRQFLPFYVGKPTPSSCRCPVCPRFCQASKLPFLFLSAEGPSRSWRPKLGTELCGWNLHIEACRRKLVLKTFGPQRTVWRQSSGNWAQDSLTLSPFYSPYVSLLLIIISNHGFPSLKVGTGGAEVY